MNVTPSPDPDIAAVYEAIDHLASEMDQNYCVGMAERDAVERKRIARHAALARLEARLEAAEKVLTGAQFFLHAMKDTIIATDSTGEGQEIAGELLSEMESLLGPYEAGNYVRALAGKDAAA